MLERRIGIFCSLPMHSIGKLALQKRLDEIGTQPRVNFQTDVGQYRPREVLPHHCERSSPGATLTVRGLDRHGRLAMTALWIRTSRTNCTSGADEHWEP